MAQIPRLPSSEITPESAWLDRRRFLAAAGVPLIGLLKTEVYAAYPEPMRPAALTMCAIFLLGLIVLPFAPETKDKPLPEDERLGAH